MTTAPFLVTEPPAPPEAPATPTAAPPEHSRWHLGTRIAFRFVCVFIGLDSAGFPLSLIPGLNMYIHRAISSFWEALVPWAGRLVGFEVPPPPTFSGSGDTQFEYARLALLVTLCVVATVLWSILDKRRTQYVKAHHVLRFVVRYVLASTMLSYGFAKVFHSQFPFPSEDRLVQPLGEFSPMGLLWTFMGYSAGYNVLTGGAEVLGGLLLLFRRTTTLGALVVIGVMVNVVALNFFYDVPVKLYSTQLLLLAVFLTAPDLRRLADVLVFNRATQAVALEPPFQLSPRLRLGLRVTKLLLVGSIVWPNATRGWSELRQAREDAPPPALQGVYDVERFLRQGQELPATRDEPHRWRRFSLNRHGVGVVRGMDVASRKTFFSSEESLEKKTLTLVEGWGEDAKKVPFTFEQPDPTRLVLRGDYEGAPIEVHLRKHEVSDSLLLKRGFNWVQEYPFNR
ncbi:DoxX family membrane protein [Myxococcus stipitatus]|uniref:DoxX family membrane protein n=1 Tax=Myxococcus stipitatus TaxID=83455 RepID=UPI001F2A7DCD|nr:DoxX family membrane protein [Myxococcus stipitatus]MCE9670650.1 DoxX family membrane protein [Myxococcus stipitatus]